MPDDLRTALDKTRYHGTKAAKPKPRYVREQWNTPTPAPRDTTEIMTMLLSYVFIGIMVLFLLSLVTHVWTPISLPYMTFMDISNVGGN